MNKEKAEDFLKKLESLCAECQIFLKVYGHEAVYLFDLIEEPQKFHLYSWDSEEGEPEFRTVF